MNARGHNERSFRLDALAAEAREGLAKVEQGEEFTIAGWLTYGLALNEGRALFPGDREFGEWVRNANLAERNGEEIHPHDRAAAMWAAANADQFEEARAAGKARTVRGIHAKWKEIEAEREKAAREAERKAEAERKKAEVEAARKEAEAKAKEEAEARDAAAAANTEEARKEAEEKAEKAATAKAEAEQKAQAAEAPAAEPDPQAEARKGLSGLTREGLEDEIVGLRAENAELREKLAMVQVERDRFKAANKELTSGEQGAIIGKLQKQIRSVTFARDEAMAAAKRMEYRLKKAEARVKELEEMGVVTL